MQTALITGASYGIGETFANELAARGMHLVLVARSADRLNALAETLRQQHQVQVEVIPQDLVQPDGPSKVYQAVKQQGLTIDLLINNAGFGEYGKFSDRPRDRHLDMIRLNVLALVDLTHQFLADMQQRRSGSIVNVASIAAFQPIPYMSVYAATKAFVLSFSEALWAETQPYGVRVLAVCPGPTETQFFKEAGFPQTFAGSTPQGMTQPEVVVRDTLKALEKNSPTVVNGGLLNNLIVNLPRFLPRPAIVRAVANQFRPSGQ
ncbi:MAG: SDR family oxidoreductase [Synechococcales bacterium]|nr:SDR family oxidoreductase [Synechococcales bacterium]